MTGIKYSEMQPNKLKSKSSDVSTNTFDLKNTANSMIIRRFMNETNQRLSMRSMSTKVSL
jgi:hypothetical protein